MTSNDVIHSFGLTEYRLKEDVMPGRITHLWFYPDKPLETHGRLRRVLRQRPLANEQRGERHPQDGIRRLARQEAREAEKEGRAKAGPHPPTSSTAAERRGREHNDTATRYSPARPAAHFIKEWIFTTDHKRVGILYLIGSIAAFVVAGIMALGIRIEQMHPGESGLINYFVGDFAKQMPTGTAYNVALYFHGAAMILAFLIPALTGFAANYLIPLMIGAPDVAFPRINALSVWLFWAGIVAGAAHLRDPRQARHHVDRLSALLGHDHRPTPRSTSSRCI